MPCAHQQAAPLTRRGNRLPDVCKGTVDGLLGLVPMLPQEHIADPLPELWSQKSILYLLLNDIVWMSKQTSWTHVGRERDQGFEVLLLLSYSWN